jgi:Xaa-Pro aminopeptidase
MIGTELAQRNARIRALLERDGLDALIVTNKETFEYFTGYRSLFWVSAARPFFAILSTAADSPMVICAAIESRNAQYNPGDCAFRFYNGFIDDALANLKAALTDLLPSQPRLAIDYGEELFGRGSLALIETLQAIGNPHPLVEAGHLVWELRCIKSEYEIARKREACRIATDAFFRELPHLQIGQSEQQFSQALSGTMLRMGAESIDWLPVRFGTGQFPGTRHPTARRLDPDDFLWTDMGCGYEGYISDLSRVAKAGDPTREQEAEYKRIRDLTLAFASAVRAGMTCDDIAREFEHLASGTRSEKGPAGRLGHGSGLSLTEPPSIMVGAQTVIQEGMILHVEPRSEAASGVFQVEEVFVVRANGIEFLSDIAPASLPVIGSRQRSAA